MKTVKIILSLFLLSIFILSFSLKNENDKKLVGIWKGFEIEKQLETEKL